MEGTHTCGSPLDPPVFFFSIGANFTRHWQIQGRGDARDAPGVQILKFSCSFQQNNPRLGVKAPLKKILDPPLHVLAYMTVADPGFSRGGCANSQKCYYFSIFFAENCMKMKEFGPPGGTHP